MMHTTGENTVFNVSEHNFKAEVLDATMPVIVDFWADWCVHCHALAPVYEQLSVEFRGRLRFTRINADEEARIAAQCGVQGLPTLLVFKDGAEIARALGPHPARLKRFVEQALATETGV